MTRIQTVETKMHIRLPVFSLSLVARFQSDFALFKTILSGTMVYERISINQKVFEPINHTLKMEKICIPRTLPILAEQNMG